jgi:hypothetical protein
MLNSGPFRFPGTGAALAILALGVAACGEPKDIPLEPAFAKPPSVPTVTATAPDTAVQDTTLDVQVSGSGFDVGSTAQWLLAGVADTTVRTNSTRYVSTRSLVANITIAKNAVPSKYDVAVTTSTGKKGIGTELFVIQLRDPSANFTVDDAAGMMVTSDGRGTYVGNTCGVGGRIYIANGGGDAVFNPYQTNPTTSPLCGGLTRVVSINLGVLGIQSVSATNVADVDHLVTSRVQDLGFGLVNSNVCTRVKYNVEVGGVNGQALVTFTGLDAFGRRTWVAESRAPHYAGCYKTKGRTQTWDGVQRVIPFRLTITEDYSH